jgi:hypothetical protein
MSKQSENFKKLVKGNPIGSITTAINMLQSSVKNELMKVRCSRIKRVLQ